ncbi:MAG: [FeFe] hydrogenase H-cluster radical SAM maturase HydE [Bacillota bacterium]|nr:[FeFe] hydrogenase H-cluster radical SAM maturase HydE [Bacillota bacterium]
MVKKNLTTDDGLLSLLSGSDDEALFAEARRIREEIYGDAVYLRGLIEFTNYCKNNCCYCGIRAGNAKLPRYRLDKETILDRCRLGYSLGFMTFVLQGGEDPYFDGPKGDDRLCDIVSAIHDEFPDCAITLSVGERSRESYKRLRDAGARRYLLRQEAASAELYRRLHPAEMLPENRLRCLYDLKDLGYQVGAGLMVGVPGQSLEHLLEDLKFMQKLQPDMIGIGPYLQHADTPLGKLEDSAEQRRDRLQLTLRLLAILRLLFPYALIPSTTALASIDPAGRTLGLRAGANVVMPNLSPATVRDKYTIYENKLSSGAEAAEQKLALEQIVSGAGYQIVSDIGDVKRG